MKVTLKLIKHLLKRYYRKHPFVIMSFNLDPNIVVHISPQVSYAGYDRYGHRVHVDNTPSQDTDHNE